MKTFNTAFNKFRIPEFGMNFTVWLAELAWWGLQRNCSKGVIIFGNM